MNNRNDWHTVSAEETAERLNVDPYKGLSEKEVRKRRSKQGKNNIWYVRRMETGKAVISAAGDLSTVLLIITAVLSCFFAEAAQAVLLCLIAVFGAVLRVAAFIKAKRILEENASENIPTAAVLREGKIRPVSSADLVAGDIVLLYPGDIVPCDGRVISEKDALVSEIGITENREHVHKYNTVIRSKPGSAAIPCESRPNILYAGSTVLEGNPIMIATALGDDALVSMKQDGIEIPSGDRLPIIDRLHSRSRNAELVMLCFIMLISAIALFTNSISLKTVFFLAVSTAAASMSGYLTAIGYIIVAITAQSDRKLRSQKGGCGAVIKDCAKIENIASAHSIILSDISLLKSGKGTLHSFFANGTVRKGNDAEEHKAELAELLSLAAEAEALGDNGSTLSQNGSDSPVRERNRITVQARKLFVEDTKSEPGGRGHVIDHVGGDSSLAMGLDVSVVQGADIRKNPYAAAAGDVKTVLRCCSTYRTPKGDMPLTNEMRKMIFTETVRLEYIGAKIVAVAVGPAPYLTLAKIPSLLTNMTFVGFFSVAEMAAEGARDAIREIKSAGCRVVLLSENPEHDLYYGHDLGLFDKDTKIVPHNAPDDVLTEAKSLIVTVPPYKHTDTAGDIAAASARYRVVCRAGGENAAFFTKEALESRSLSVSGCGIAVSRSGKKAAAQVLKNHAGILVYPNAEEEHGGFAEGLSAIKEARRAVINTANASLYLTAAQLTRLFLLLVSVGFGLALPNPAAVLASGLIFDFGAVLAMSFEKAPKNVLSIPCGSLPSFWEQIRKTVVFGLLAGLLSVGMPLLVNGLAPLLHIHPLNGREAVTVLTASMFLSQLVLAVQFMKRGRILRRGITVSSASMLFAVSVLAISVLVLFEKNMASLVGGASVPWYGAVSALLPAVIVFVVMEIVKKVGEAKNTNPHALSK